MIAAEKNGLNTHQIIRMRLLAQTLYRTELIDWDDLARMAKEESEK